MPDVQVSFLLMLFLGVTSSLHCVSMCGPLIAIASAPLVETGHPSRKTFWHIFYWQGVYHLGRGITYITLGMVLATTSTFITSLFSSKIVGSIVQIGLGCLIVVMGVWLLWQRRGVRSSEKNSFFTRCLRSLVTKAHGGGMFGLGLLTGFLPCGVLYAAFARAFSSTTALEGGVLMFAFWIGTTPLLFSLGFLSGGIVRWVGKYATVLIFTAMCFTGGSLMYKGTLRLNNHANQDRQAQQAHRHSCH